MLIPIARAPAPQGRPHAWAEEATGRDRHAYAGSGSPGPPRRLTRRSSRHGVSARIQPLTHRCVGTATAAPGPGTEREGEGEGEGEGEAWERAQSLLEEAKVAQSPEARRLLAPAMEKLELLVGLHERCSAPSAALLARRRRTVPGNLHSPT